MNQLEAGGSAIGVDVGGTKVAAGFVDTQGEIHQHTRVPMNSRGTAEEGLAAVTGAIDQLLELEPETSNTPRRIGICAPGHSILAPAIAPTVPRRVKPAGALLRP